MDLSRSPSLNRPVSRRSVIAGLVATPVLLAAGRGAQTALAAQPPALVTPDVTIHKSVINGGGFHTCLASRGNELLVGGDVFGVTKGTAESVHGEWQPDSAGLDQGGNYAVSGMVMTPDGYAFALTGTYVAHPSPVSTAPAGPYTSEGSALYVRHQKGDTWVKVAGVDEKQIATNPQGPAGWSSGLQRVMGRTLALVDPGAPGSRVQLAVAGYEGQLTVLTVELTLAGDQVTSAKVADTHTAYRAPADGSRTPTQSLTCVAPVPASTTGGTKLLVGALDHYPPNPSPIPTNSDGEIIGPVPPAFPDGLPRSGLYLVPPDNPRNARTPVTVYDEKSSSPSDIALRARDIVVDPVDSSYVYVAALDQGIFRSTNHGKSFHRLPLPHEVCPQPTRTTKGVVSTRTYYVALAITRDGTLFAASGLAHRDVRDPRGRLFALPNAKESSAWLEIPTPPPNQDSPPTAPADIAQDAGRTAGSVSFALGGRRFSFSSLVAHSFASGGRTTGIRVIAAGSSGVWKYVAPAPQGPSAPTSGWQATGRWQDFYAGKGTGDPDFSGGLSGFQCFATGGRVDATGTMLTVGTSGDFGVLGVRNGRLLQPEWVAGRPDEYRPLCCDISSDGSVLGYGNDLPASAKGVPGGGVVLMTERGTSSDPVLELRWIGGPPDPAKSDRQGDAAAQSRVVGIAAQWTDASTPSTTPTTSTTKLPQRLYVATSDYESQPSGAAPKEPTPGVWRGDLRSGQPGHPGPENYAWTQLQAPSVRFRLGPHPVPVLLAAGKLFLIDRYSGPMMCAAPDRGAPDLQDLLPTQGRGGYGGLAVTTRDGTVTLWFGGRDNTLKRVVDPRAAASSATTLLTASGTVCNLALDGEGVLWFWVEDGPTRGLHRTADPFGTNPDSDYVYGPGDGAMWPDMYGMPVSDMKAHPKGAGVLVGFKQGAGVIGVTPAGASVTVTATTTPRPAAAR